MAPQQPPDLLDRVEAYMLKHRLAASQFGMMVNREPGLVSTLRRGRQCRERVLGSVLAFISKPPPHRQTRGARIAAGYREAKARNIKTEREAALHRASDPLEQAKRYLQQQRYVVFAASVISPYRTGWVVGSKPDPLDDDALIEFARHRGWKAEGETR